MRTLFKQANILTMESQNILRGMDLLVEDGKIAGIGPEIRAEAETVIDAAGKYLMPGLFDMHVHFNDNTMARLFIAFGVTSTRCMWGYPIVRRWEKLSKADEMVCPNIYSTSPLMDGVCYWEGTSLVTSEQQAEQKVRRYFEQGYRMMKVYPSIPKPALARIFSVSNELGARVVGHKSLFFSGKELADMGLYSIEHAGQLPDDLEEVQYMAESGMWFCPTQTVEDTIRDYVYGDKALDAADGADCVPAVCMKEWKSTTQWRKTNGRYDLSIPYNSEAILQKARVFIKHSKNVLLGTDAPNPGVTAGYSLHAELENMVRVYGLSEFEALETGTTRAARHLGLEHCKGKVKEGLDADLILLQANPLEDIKNTKKICAVMKGRQYFDAGRLKSLLETARNVRDEEVYDVFLSEGEKN